MARILVIDDSPSESQFLSAVLMRAKHDVVVAADRDAGLRNMKTSRPDLVLLDDDMPGMTETVFAQEVQADAALKDVPFLLISNGTRAEVQAEIVGARLILPRPVVRDDLLDAISSHAAR